MRITAFVKSSPTAHQLAIDTDRLGIPLEAVQVEASADFPGIGLAATDIRYFATVRSSASQDEIARLLAETDAVAEVHNTLRAGSAVTFAPR